MTLYTLAEKNVRKTWLYLAFFLGLIIGMGYLIAYFYSNWAFFWGALILSLISGLTSYWFSDKIVLGMTGAKKVEKKDFPELYRIVENLCITAGLPMPEIYVIKDSSPNAFATGRDPKHSVVVVTQGLLNKLERVELEGVISHELSHIGNRDILLATIVVVLVGLVVRLTHFFFRIRIGGRDREEKGGSVFAILGVVALILAPILAQLMKLAISRKREFLADATGALLTRYPEGLASALEKISQDPHSLRKASNATAHLFIANPFKGKQKRNWLVKLFSTHPPAQERIQALRNMEV